MKTDVTAQSRSRICIPNKFVRRLGLQHGDTAYVYEEPDQLKVSSRQYSTKKLVGKYCVDKDDNIRLSGGVVNNGCLDYGYFYGDAEINKYHHDILVTPY